MTPKNSLNIRLTESVVFLRGSAETTVTGRRTTREAQPAMLRGLLTLTLDKPTKISSIEITLEGKTQTSWPEGAGARRLEVTEDHDIFSATSVYFRAGKTHTTSARRTASVGPGLSFDHEEIEDETGSNEDSGHHSLSMPTPPWQRDSRRRVSMDVQYMHPSLFNDIPTPPYSPPTTRPGSIRADDSSQSISMTMPRLAHRMESWTSNGSNVSRPEEHLEPPQLPRGNSEPQSSSSSVADIPLSLHESHEESDVPLHGRSTSRGRPRIPAMHANGVRSGPHTPSVSTAPSSPLVARNPALLHDSAGSSADDSTENSSSVLESQSGTADAEPHTDSASSHRELGRRHARFSLAMVSNVLLDAVKERVRSNSPRQHEGKEHAFTPTVSRDHSPEASRISRVQSETTDHSVDSETERGRRILRDEGGAKQKEKERSTLGRISGALGIHAEGTNGDGDGWKEFKKGTYTYPISFAIPGDSPPSLQCDFGTVKYHLKATVHRPGTFTQRLTATREVTLIACPGEDDVDECDNIVVQREWDTQMLYMIIISGRAFPIGSSIPIHITFMPIAKIKIFRISAIIEERVEYYTQFKKVVRAEAVRKFELLSARYQGKDALPVLPLMSDFTTSPLHGLVDAEDESEAASSLMGPGPWTIQALLQLPKSCSRMHFTNKHKRSNIGISHILKVVFRVERGDDAFVDVKTGIRKHFDIVVQTPLHILSCRCNPEWTSLPRYSSSLAFDSVTGTQTCPCTKRKEGIETSIDEIEPAILPSVTTTPVASGSGPHYTPFHAFLHPFETHVESPITEAHTTPTRIHAGGQMLVRLPSDIPSDLVSLYRRNTQFARLVAGEESEAGEPPPQYESVASQENVFGAQASAITVPTET